MYGYLSQELRHYQVTVQPPSVKSKGTCQPGPVTQLSPIQVGLPLPARLVQDFRSVVILHSRTFFFKTPVLLGHGVCERMLYSSRRGTRLEERGTSGARVYRARCPKKEMESRRGLDLQQVPVHIPQKNTYVACYTRPLYLRLRYTLCEN